MEQLLTANVATNLYWFGRYLERIEATLIEVVEAFDKIIDTDKNCGKDFFEKLGIDLEYTCSKDFLNKAVFGNHHANSHTLIGYAKENAIICRSVMDTEAFGSVVELGNLLKHSGLDIDCRYIDNVLS